MYSSNFVVVTLHCDRGHGQDILMGW